MLNTYQRNLEQALLRAHLVSEDTLREAKAQQEASGRSLDRVLVLTGKTTEDAMLRALAHHTGADTVKIAEQEVDGEALTLLPRALCDQHRVFPLSRTEDTLRVAMTTPSDVLLLDELRRAAGLRIAPVLALEEDILRAIDRHYAGHLTVDAETRQEMQDRTSSRHETVVIDRLQKLVDEAPVVHIVDAIIEDAISQRASDIHVEPQAGKLFIRYRIDGIMYDHSQPSPEMHAAMISRLKIMAKMNIAERRLPQDGRIPVSVQGKEYDIRVSTVPSTAGEKAVLRILQKSEEVLQLEDLGMPSTLRPQFERWIRRPHGMLLVTGPTGSGKTTTLYAALSEIDAVGKNVITVEDPVEYQLGRITQIQVHPNIGLTFAAGLRSMLRQDPDIIMVGEIRDLDTLSMAVQAALTGHLVLSTLHCNDAAGAAARCVDMGLEPFLLASALTCVIAQRLIRRICTECKEVHEVPAEVLDRLRLEPNGKLQFYRGKGCGACRGTGYFGRVACFECISLTDEIQSAILHRRPASEIREIATTAGMPPLLTDGLAKARAGITTIEEVLRAIHVDD